MKIKYVLLFLLAVSLLVPSYTAAREEKEKTGKEELEATISHLLEFVRNSDVVFIRNGREHKPEDAAKHIEKKYNHYRKKIKTPEDFIEKSATKSMMSGKLYQVRLEDGTVVATRDWLLEELERYRAGEAAEAPPDSTVKDEGCEDGPS